MAIAKQAVNPLFEERNGITEHLVFEKHRVIVLGYNTNISKTFLLTSYLFFKIKVMVAR